MNDPLGRGIFAGTLGVIAINILEYILTLLGISETALWEAGGMVFLSAEALTSTLGIAIGIFSHVFVAIIVGVSISYYIYFSGTNFAISKGLGISLMAMFITLGIFFPLREIATEMQDSPSDVLAAIMDHIVFGALAGYIVKYMQNKEMIEDELVPLSARRVLKSKIKHHPKFIRPKKI